MSYRCRVYLNGKEIGSHEGGFTPFQFNITDLVKAGENFLAVEVNNTRTVDAIPALSFDWWNYGGITRDVMLVRTPKYISAITLYNWIDTSQIIFMQPYNCQSRKRARK